MRKSSQSVNTFAITLARVFFVGTIGIIFLYKPSVQAGVDQFWEFLKSKWVFNSVYFETWYVTVLYTVLLLIPASVDRLPWFNRYKINPAVQFQHPSTLQVVQESIVYMIPLGLLDTFMVKWYSTVPESQIRYRSQQWIQVTRALPQQSPKLLEILTHLSLSLIIYDAIFWVVHLIFHKNCFLYKYGRFHVM